MITILGIMFVGMGIGYLLRNSNLLEKITDKAVMLSIYLLLFFIGVSVGANELIIKNLGRIGETALFLTIGAVTGTVLVSFFVYKFFLKTSKKKENERELGNCRIFRNGFTALVFEILAQFIIEADFSHYALLFLMFVVRSFNRSKLERRGKYLENLENLRILVGYLLFGQFVGDI